MLPVIAMATLTLPTFTVTPRPVPAASSAVAGAPPPEIYYPEKARQLGVAGDVTIRCDFDGTYNDLKNCKVEKEKPKGMGFGDSAVRLATTYFTLSQRNLIDLRSSIGSLDDIDAVLTFKFRMGGDAAEPASSNSGAAELQSR